MIRAVAAPLVALMLFAAPASASRAEPDPAPPAPAASSLPEIGRTRATSAACAVMRDIVIRAFATAQHADARFGAVRTTLPQYIQLKADYNSQRAPVKSDGIMLESQYNRLSIDTAVLLRDADAIRKLLADPRLSAASSDPAVREEREQLERLLDAQQARANYLSQLMLRESTYLSKRLVGFEDPGGLPVVGIVADADAPPRPLPIMTAPRGMPVLTGFDAADRARVNEWGAAMASMVHTSEEQAAKTFLPLAQACR